MLQLIQTGILHNPLGKKGVLYNVINLAISGHIINII